MRKTALGVTTKIFPHDSSTRWGRLGAVPPVSDHTSFLHFRAVFQCKFDEAASLHGLALRLFECLGPSYRLLTANTLHLWGMSLVEQVIPLEQFKEVQCGEHCAGYRL